MNNDTKAGLELAAIVCEKFAEERRQACLRQTDVQLKADMASESHAAQECATRIRNKAVTG